MTKELSYPKDRLKVLLLEGIHESAQHSFQQAGYPVDSLAISLSEQELVDKLSGYRVLGIRSKTNINQNVLKQANHLIAVGCFCIGTNQVALKAASDLAIPVFNAPFSNTRSVAELTMAEIVMLARQAAHKSSLLHKGSWLKSAAQSYEVRHKTIGIVGYGHIGPQVGLLAEAFGMRVVFYDIVKKLPLGNAKPVDSLKQLLQESDFVTLHVPETPLTKGMISEKELQLMKQGSYLLNLSRGSIVELEALRLALESSHLAGAALDVYPAEPKSNNETFSSALQGLDNVILTPHIGGSTQEAQESIGQEVATSLIQFLDLGNSSGAVNFPNVDIPAREGAHRVLNIHKNVPGVLSAINQIVADTGANIMAQSLSTNETIGYLVMDVGPELSREVKKHIDGLDATIRTRLLF